MAVQSQGDSPPGSEKPAGWDSVLPGAGYWGALVSGAGCEAAAQVHAHWATPRDWEGPGHQACCAPAARPASEAAAAGDWELGSETCCWSTSGAPRAGRRPRAGLEPGLCAGGRRRTSGGRLGGQARWKLRCSWRTLAPGMARRWVSWFRGVLELAF